MGTDNEFDHEKDRRHEIPVVYGVSQILYLRSSARPLRYAIVLCVKRDGVWDAVASVDNSHERDGVDRDHLHRYSAGQKLAPEPLPFSVKNTNDAMVKAIHWLADNWEELSS